MKIRHAIIAQLMLQRLLAYILLIVLYPILCFILLFIYRYHIIDLKILRKNFKDICAKVDGPLLVCANHLTFIDPIIIIWACGSLWYYILNYNRFMWNFPNERYVRKYWWYSLFFYIGKCISVPRHKYQRKIKHTIDKMHYLISKNETLLIFPEGQRSKIGKVDLKQFTKGIGRLLKKKRNLSVLCVYHRGLSHCLRAFPNKGEKFHIAFRLVQTKIDNEANIIESYTMQIMETLHQMENYYIKTRRSV